MRRSTGMTGAKVPPRTIHRVRWGEHEDLLQRWKHAPPAHPENPRYTACDVEVAGRYSLFESVVNVFRQRGWLDAPPADYKWAVLTVTYKAPRDPRDRFASLGPRRGRRAS